MAHNPREEAHGMQQSCDLSREASIIETRLPQIMWEESGVFLLCCIILGYVVYNKNKAKVPKLPMFADGKDELDSYLNRLDRFAAKAGWKKESWATKLSAFLTGKALEVYSRLDSDAAKTMRS